jgi:hypothetical protein
MMKNDHILFVNLYPFFLFFFIKFEINWRILFYLFFYINQT